MRRRQKSLDYFLETDAATGNTTVRPACAFLDQLLKEGNAVFGGELVPPSLIDALQPGAGAPPPTPKLQAALSKKLFNLQRAELDKDYCLLVIASGQDPAPCRHAWAYNSGKAKAAPKPAPKAKAKPGWYGVGPKPKPAPAAAASAPAASKAEPKHTGDAAKYICTGYLAWRAAALHREVCGMLSAALGSSGLNSIRDNYFTHGLTDYLGLPHHNLAEHAAPAAPALFEGTEEEEEEGGGGGGGQPPAAASSAATVVRCLLCAAPLDPCGHHALTCSHNKAMNAEEHTSLKNIVTNSLRSAGCTVKVEPAAATIYPRNPKSPKPDTDFRLDLAFTLPGAPGSIMGVDVTTAASFAQKTRVNAVPGTLAAAAEKLKTDTYNANFTIKDQSTFFPAAVESNGVFGAGTKRLLRLAARSRAGGLGPQIVGTHYRWLCESVAIVTRSANARKYSAYLTKCVAPKGAASLGGGGGA